MKGEKVQVSVPSRIDFGGFWDIKSLAFLYRHIKPSTFNFAINQYLYVTVRPYEVGKVKIITNNSVSEIFSGQHLPFTSNNRLVCAIVSYFNISGIEIEISSDFPSRSGLGGSGALSVALIYALYRYSDVNFALNESTRKKIIKLASDIEDGLRISMTGHQDQAAAIYGGVNFWEWNLDDSINPFLRLQLGDQEIVDSFNSRIAVVFSGDKHFSGDVNEKVLAHFFSGEEREKWIQINFLIHDMKSAILDRKWDQVATLIEQEVVIRKDLTPYIYTDEMLSYMQVANETNCVARHSGAGGGGCVWAFGNPQDIFNLKNQWRDMSKVISGAELLDVKVSQTGLKEIK